MLCLLKTGLKKKGKFLNLLILREWSCIDEFVLGLSDCFLGVGKNHL